MSAKWVIFNTTPTFLYFLYNQMAWRDYIYFESICFQTVFYSISSIRLRWRQTVCSISSFYKIMIVLAEFHFQEILEMREVKWFLPCTWYWHRRPVSQVQWSTAFLHQSLTLHSVICTCLLTSADTVSLVIFQIIELKCYIYITVFLDVSKRCGVEHLHSLLLVMEL